MGSNVEVFIFAKEENESTRGDVLSCMKSSRPKNASSDRKISTRLSQTRVRMEWPKRQAWSLATGLSKTITES